MKEQLRKSPDFVNGRYVLLTYAQCGNLDPFGVMEHISSLAGECIVGREHHEDGGIHLHVFCDFGRKFRSRRVDVFDVGGKHPNVSKSYGTPEKGYDYAIKDGDVVCGGLGRPSRPTRGDLDGETDSLWHQIAEAKTRDQFWELVHLYDPRAAITSFPAIAKYADWKFAYQPPVYESPANAQFVGQESDGRDDWLLEVGIGAERSGARVRSLVLFGPSKTGKTTWARSLGEHIYVLGLVGGKECSRAPDVDYAVFDDIRGGIKFFPAFKEWLGGQASVTVKELYREPRLLPWGKPCIWCANKDPRLEMDPVDQEWMNANCLFVEITEEVVTFH
nr:replication-associated protein [Tick-associated circular DNA virus]